MSSKIILGTAQFGLNYGINNKRGKIPEKEVFEILDYCRRVNISILDTAHDYGGSEKIIGNFIRNKRVNFKIISKLPTSCLGNIKNYLRASLQNLNIKKLYGYLIHDFNSFLREPKILSLLRKYKEKGLIKNIGFSIYHPKELEYLFKNNIDFDIIQLPYSIFDQRFAPFFSQLQEKEVKLYTRSVFLQGLVFKKMDKFGNQFKKLKKRLVILRNLAQKMDISISALCLNFVCLNKYIDKILIGINNLDNLKEDAAALRYLNRVKDIYDDLLVLKEDDEKIISPLNWK